MNTKDDWKTTAHALDPERAGRWQYIFGQPRCPIKSIIPTWTNLPGFDRPQLIYEMDIRAITSDQRRRLVEDICTQFQVGAMEVERDLDQVGVPVLAEKTNVTSTDFGHIAGIVSDAEELQQQDVFSVDELPF